MSVRATGRRSVGEGFTVFEDAEPVHGVTRWLDSPEDVVAFVDEEDVENTIVIARGGTTTFLTPALVAGIKGIVTLQGAPTSHLGIISREYGIPCLMSVAFTEGEPTSRGELVPPDGTLLALDVASSPRGWVMVDEGVSLGTGTPATPTGDSRDDAPSTEAQRRLDALLTNYRLEVPHGKEGVAEVLRRQQTNVMQLTADSFGRDLTMDEVNDLIYYAGWSNWDALAARATEGESGLIPRQEYESLGILQMWHGLPKWWHAIRAEIGDDGVRQLGAIARHEIGTKINVLHGFVTGTGPASGRGLAIALGHHSASDRADDIRGSMEFCRLTWQGMWGDDNGMLFPSTRGFRAPLLDASWIERFSDERTSVADPDARRAFQRFNGGSGLLSFLHHFDNRLGVGDSGPYPVPGGWVVVRDHVINEPAYAWSKACGNLPYSVTLAMFFAEKPPIETWLMDVGTLYTRPANYLANLTAFVVYARDRYDSPMSEVRLLSPDELVTLRGEVEAASGRLYAEIAAMTFEERVRAGVQVYYVDWVAPFARAAGLWDKFVNEMDLYTIDPLTEASYERLVTNGEATHIVPPLFIEGSGFQPLTGG